MNNILGAVQAIVQTLRQKHRARAGCCRPGDHRPGLDLGPHLVRGLTRFVRKELEEPEILDLNDLGGRKWRSWAALPCRRSCSRWTCRSRCRR